MDAGVSGIPYIPFEEIPGYSLRRNQFGLDELSRPFMGGEEDLDSFRSFYLPGTPDSEFPALTIGDITEDGMDGNLVRASVNFVGMLSGGDGSDKAPQHSRDLALKTGTAAGTQTRSYDYVSQTLNGIETYSTNTYTAEGEISFDYYTPTITFRYARNFDVTSPQYESEAATKLAGMVISAFNKTFKATNGWPLLPESYTNRVLRDPVITDDLGMTKMRLSQFNSEQRGVWFEVTETWELYLGNGD